VHVALAVHVGQCVQQLLEDDRDCRLLVLVLGDEPRESPPVEILDADVDRVFRLVDLVNLQNVRVVKFAHYLYLILQQEVTVFY
jgi:hypothetical protein